MAPGDQVGPLVERRTKLGDEPALADPRLADDGDELHRRLALRAEEGLEEQRLLVLAADERRLGRGLGLTDRLRASSARQTGIGSAFPFASTGS